MAISGHLWPFDSFLSARVSPLSIWYRNKQDVITEYLVMMSVNSDSERMKNKKNKKNKHWEESNLQPFSLPLQIFHLGIFPYCNCRCHPVEKMEFLIFKHDQYINIIRLQTQRHSTRTELRDEVRVRVHLDTRQERQLDRERLKA